MLLSTEQSIFSVMAGLAIKNNAINLGQGYPDYPISDKLKSLVAHYVKEDKNQYAPMAGLVDLRERLSEKYHAAYSRTISAENEITIHAGATQAIYMAISAFVKEGDEVIIIEPAYDCYLPTITLMGAKAVPVSVRAPAYRVDWTEVESKISDRTRMIIINNPHNPIGKIYEKEDLLALQEIVRSKNVIVLSDEVYEHLVYDGKKHESVLAYPQLADQSIAVYSFGKTFHSTGWKVGYSIAPEYMMKEIRNLHQWNVYCVSSFVQYALADFLSDPKEYEKLPAFFQRKRDLLKEALSDTKLRPLSCAGTYFQLYDYSEISDLPDLEFSRWLVQEHGVATIPISPFYENRQSDKVVRFCFAKQDETLLKAAERLARL